MPAAGGDRSPLVLTGAGLYPVGVVGVTVVASVPLNDALARAQIPWTDQLRRWTTWNTVRTLASSVSGALLVVFLAGGPD